MRWEGSLARTNTSALVTYTPQDTCRGGPGLLYFKLEDGNVVVFGLAQDGTGPLPALCNLWLAVTRTLVLSGAAQLMGVLTIRRLTHPQSPAKWRHLAYTFSNPASFCKCASQGGSFVFRNAIVKDPMRACLE